MSAPDIFYVEDDVDFAFIMQHAVQEVNSNLSLKIVDNGPDALDTLLQFGINKVRPGLIMLDMNLPGMSGLDLLKRIKEIPFLKTVPVVFFTTSDNPKDIQATAEFGANAYLTKPAGYLNLINCVNSLYDFWFNKHQGVN